MVQLESFSTEVRLLSEGQLLVMARPKHFRLRKLSPILINGLVCVGGRLQWSSWTEAAKHPAILPSRHAVTDLIIRHYHEMEGHVGVTQVLAALRKRFWILKGGASVRRVVNNCARCRRVSARPCTQVMAPLPTVRIEETGRAFSAVGVDYFGPLYVKRARAEEKRYGCLFTCLNVRAVHIEVAHTLSTDSFIQALSRFIARRGQPRIIYSDNGSNFRGAETELKYCLQNWSQSKINNYLVTRDIEWNFTPPEASHWGGVWERMIRSIKNILSVTIRGHRINDEGLSTFLCEAERILNDRPLVPLDDDSESLEVLTPSKFLLLRDNTVYTDGLVFSKHCVRVWRRIQWF
ncbi:integrase zinc binding domain-containing protein, partial [Streptococcus dysgalactiae]|uniref:integrase zinc binding domain-containing protein n=1 Tax=Streptococcus dysgalactiae TaxID=1334 RepID=UPI00194FE492